MLDLDRQILDGGDNRFLLRALDGRAEDEEEEGVELLEALDARGVLAHHQGIRQGDHHALAESVLEEKGNKSWDQEESMKGSKAVKKGPLFGISISKS